MPEMDGRLDGQGGGGAAPGNSRFGWGTIKGTSQISGRRGLTMKKEERRVETERGMKQAGHIDVCASLNQ